MPAVPTLTILSEELKGKRFELTEQVYTVGRSDKQKISIPVTTISSLHCELVKAPDGSYAVKDAGSTNGTRINGVKITAQKLTDSDILQIGGVELMYKSNDGTPGAQHKTQPRVAPGPKTELNTVRNLAPEWDQQRQSSRKWNVVFLVVIGLLSAVVLALMGILFYMFKQAG